MWTTFEDALNFAAQREAASAALYEGASLVAERPEARAMFEELASEERKHRKLLEGMSRESVYKYEMKRKPDLKIADRLADVAFSPGMRYDEILILAVKGEAKSVQLYKALEKSSDDREVKKLFQVLAQEEAEHKRRLEKEYEEHVLTDN